MAALMGVSPRPFGGRSAEMLDTTWACSNSDFRRKFDHACNIHTYSLYFNYGWKLPKCRQMKLRSQAGGEAESLDGSMSSNGTQVADGNVTFEPLEGSYTYKQLRNLTMEQLKYELNQRNLPYLGYRSQLAGRLYQALQDEGRGLIGEEAAKVDALIELEYEDSSVDEEAVMAAMMADPLLGYQNSCTGALLEEDSESVMSNKAGFQTIFLSTLTSENGMKTATSVAVRTLQSVWLFECGEDTQRSLIGHPLVDWKRIDRIFVSSMDPESVLGVPGMLCTISASRSKGHEAADIPIHVYGPPGLVGFVSSMLSVSRTYLEMPVIVHEFTPGPIPSESYGQPVEVLKRSRLYALKLPPDQLNPEGYYDAELSAMLSRHTKKKNGGGSDLRSGTLPQNLPEPGDPERKGLAVSSMTWTIRADNEWVITAAPVKNNKPCLAFKATESDRAGRLYPEIAQALGVYDSNQYAQLKAGRTVQVEDGTVIRPEQCVGPTRVGRTIGIVPPCQDSSTFAATLGSVNLLVHAMVATSKDGTIQSIAKVAGKCARDSNADELVLWQPLTSFMDTVMSNDPAFPVKIIEEAKEELDSSVDFISLGGSYAAHQWDREDADRFPTDVPEEVQHLLHE